MQLLPTGYMKRTIMWKRAVCTKDCPDTCGLLVEVEVEDGRIVTVKGDPGHPFTDGFICEKAGHFPEHVHSAKRITTPLRRTGPKGAGEFAPIKNFGTGGLRLTTLKLV